MTSASLARALELIDAANGADPETIATAGGAVPAARAYGERMSAALGRLDAAPSEALQIAARGQHVERWTISRSSYGEGRLAYLKWRKDLQAFHARRLGELMAEAGYGAAERGRVAAIVAKAGLKSDAEVQTLEDAACLVFLQYHAADLFERYDDAKVIDILAKTARKMSPEGLALAGTLDLPERHRRLLGQALAG